MTIGPKKNKTESTVLSLIFGAIYIVNFDVLIEKKIYQTLRVFYSIIWFRSNGPVSLVNRVQRCPKIVCYSSHDVETRLKIWYSILGSKCKEKASEYQNQLFRSWLEIKTGTFSMPYRTTVVAQTSKTKCVGYWDG